MQLNGDAWSNESFQEIAGKHSTFEDFSTENFSLSLMDVDVFNSNCRPKIQEI